MTSLNGQNDNINDANQVKAKRVSDTLKLTHTHTLNEWKMISSNQDVITITLNTVDSLTNRLNRFILQHHSTHLHTHTHAHYMVIAFYPLCVCFVLNTSAYGTARSRRKYHSNQEFSGTQHIHTVRETL